MTEADDEWVRIPFLVLGITSLSYLLTNSGADGDAVWIHRHETADELDLDDIGEYRWLLIRREVADSLNLI